MSQASNYLLYDKAFTIGHSIPKCFYNFLLFIDMDRHQLITKYKLKEKCNITAVKLNFRIFKDLLILLKFNK